MLGGRPQIQSQTQLHSQSLPTSQNKEHWKITSKELNAVLDFAEDSQRFARKEVVGD